MVCIAAVGFEQLTGSESLRTFEEVLGNHLLLLSPVATFDANFIFVIALFVYLAIGFVLLCIAHRTTRNGSRKAGEPLYLAIALHFEFVSIFLFPIARRCLLLLECDSRGRYLQHFPDHACTDGTAGASMFLSSASILFAILTTMIHAMFLHPTSNIVIMPLDRAAIFSGSAAVLIRLLPAVALVVNSLVPLPWLCGIVSAICFIVLRGRTTVPTVFAFRDMQTLVSASSTVATAYSALIVLLSIIGESDRQAVSIPFLVLVGVLSAALGVVLALSAYNNVARKIAFMSRSVAHMVPTSSNRVAPSPRTAIDMESQDGDSDSVASSCGDAAGSSEDDSWKSVLGSADNVVVVLRFLMSDRSLSLHDRVQRALSILEGCLSEAHNVDPVLWLHYLAFRMQMALSADVFEKYSEAASNALIQNGSTPSPSYLADCEVMKHLLDDCELDPRLSQRVLRELIHGQLTSARRGGASRKLSWIQRYEVAVMSIRAISLANVLTANAGDSLIVNPLMSAPQAHYERCVKQLRIFWRTLLSDKTSISTLPPLIASVHEHANAARSEYMLLIERFPRDSRVLRAYARFLSDVDAHPLLAAEYMDRAAALDEEEAGKRRDPKGTKDASRRSGAPKKVRHDSTVMAATPSDIPTSVSFAPAAGRGVKQFPSVSVDVEKGEKGSSQRLSVPGRSPTASGYGSSFLADDAYAAERFETQSSHSHSTYQQSVGTAAGNGNSAPQQAAKVSLWREKVERSSSSSLVRLRIAVALAVALLVLGFIGAFILARLLLTSYDNTGKIIDFAGQNRKFSQSCAYNARRMQYDYSLVNFASTSYRPSRVSRHAQTLVEDAQALYQSMQFLIDAPGIDKVDNNRVWNNDDSVGVNYVASTGTWNTEQYALKDLVFKLSFSALTVSGYNASLANTTQLLADPSFRFIFDNAYTYVYTELQHSVDKLVSLFQGINKSYQTGLIVQISMALVIPVLLWLFVFWPAHNRFVRERHEMFHLFPTLPKPVVRKAYLHAGGKDVDAAKTVDVTDDEAGLTDTEKMQQALENSDDVMEGGGSGGHHSNRIAVSRDPLRKTTWRFIITCVLCAMAMCVLAAEGFFYVAMFQTMTNEVNYSGLRRTSLRRARALAQEMLDVDVRAFPGGLQQLRDLLTAEVALFMKVDRAIRVGDSSLGLPGSDGQYGHLDDLYYEQQCADMTLFACQSGVQMLDTFAGKLTEWANVPTDSISPNNAVFRALGTQETAVSDLMERASVLYSSRFDATVETMSIVANTVFGCTLPVLVLLILTVFIAIDELEQQTRRTRTIYLLLPCSYVESTPLVQSVALGMAMAAAGAEHDKAGDAAGMRDLSKASRSQLIAHASDVSKRYRRLVEASKDGILELAIHDGEPRIDTCNLSFLAMMNARDSATVAGRLLYSFLAKEGDVTATKTALQLILGCSDDSDFTARKSVQVVLSKCDGSTFPARLDMAKSGATVVMFVRDLTDIRRKEDLISREKQRSEDLLRNMMPDKIARRLQNGETLIADLNEQCTIFFSDIKSFTELSTRLSPKQIIFMLNTLLTGMDRLAKHYLCERVKSIGDAAFVVCGVPEPRADHAERVVEFAIGVLQMLDIMNNRGMLLPNGEHIDLRIGIHSGPVVSGVIGEKPFAFDLWGDSVNLASRMESTGVAGRIQLSRATYELVWNQYDFEDRGVVEVKGKGAVNTYMYRGRTKPSRLPEPQWDQIIDMSRTESNHSSTVMQVRDSETSGNDNAATNE
jgi:class 3 adenylate cyclase